MTRYIQPSVVPWEDVDLSWMVGRSIVAIGYQEPGLRYIAPAVDAQAFTTEFTTDGVRLLDPAIWSFGIGQDASITVEGLWRIIQHDHVKLTSDDHGRQFGLPAPVDAVARSNEAFRGRRITAVQLREFTADVVIELDDETRFEIIASSSGYESWQVRAPSGTEIFAQGGGQICGWKA